MKPQSFEEFLKDIHTEEYYGTDDNMPDSFDNFMTDLEQEDLIEYANMYGIKMHALGVSEIKIKE